MCADVLSRINRSVLRFIYQQINHVSQRKSKKWQYRGDKKKIVPQAQLSILSYKWVEYSIWVVFKSNRYLEVLEQWMVRKEQKIYTGLVSYTKPKYLTGKIYYSAKIHMTDWNLLHFFPELTPPVARGKKFKKKRREIEAKHVRKKRRQQA